MLAKRPEDRFQDPAEIVAALEPLAAGADLPRLLSSAAAADESFEDTPLDAWTDTSGEFVSIAPARRSLSASPVAVPRRPRTARGRWLIAAAAGACLAAVLAPLFFSRTPIWKPKDEVADLGADLPPTNRDGANADDKDGPLPMPHDLPPPPKKTFEDLPDALLEPLVSYPLLNREPQKLIWPDRSESSTAPFDPSRRQLVVQSSDVAMLSLGQVHRPDYILRIDLHQQRWPGGVGIFLGYNEGQEDGHRVVTFQRMYLKKGGVPERPQYVISRFREKRTFVPGQPVKATNYEFVGAAIEPPGDNPQSLEVIVRSGRLHRVRFAGAELKDLCTAEANKTLEPKDYVGHFGTYNFYSQSVFQNASIVLLGESSD